MARKTTKSQITKTYTEQVTDRGQLVCTETTTTARPGWGTQVASTAIISDPDGSTWTEFHITHRDGREVRSLRPLTAEQYAPMLRVFRTEHKPAAL